MTTMIMSDLLNETASMFLIPIATDNITDSSSTSPVSNTTDIVQNVPGDNIFMAGGTKGDLLTDVQRQDVEVILDCGIRSSVAILGVFTNLANLVVLAIQGLRDSVNVALFSLSLSDLAYVVTALPGQAFCFHLNTDRLLANSMKQEFVPQGMMLGITFSRVSSALTALISVERCICVMLPLKVQRIVTYRCTLFMIIAIVVILFAFFVPVLMMLEVQYFEVGPNATVAFALPTKFYLDNFTFLSVFGDTVISVVIPLSLLAVVAVCTTLTVLKLKLSSRWRQAVSSAKSTDGDSKNAAGESDEKTARLTRMMVAIACVYIVCIIPGTVSTLVRLFIPEFNLNNKYHNTFAVVYALDFTMQTANASVNFFVYMTMSSRFRAVFGKLLGRVCCKGRQPALKLSHIAHTQCSSRHTEQSGVSMSSVAQ